VQRYRNRIQAPHLGPFVLYLTAVLLVSAALSIYTVYRVKASPNSSSDSSHEEKAEDALWERRFSGLWSLIQIIITETKVPVVGTLTAKTEIVSLYSLSFREQRLSGKGKLCSMTVDSGTNLVETRFPAAFLRSLPRPEFNARLIRKKDEWHLYQEKRYMVVGAKLKDNRADRLPDKASDPRVFDQDGDGNPGVTVRIDGIASGDIFVTQRTWTELTGRLQAPGRFSGKIGYGNEQVILDATSWYLKHPLQMKPSNDRSRFYLIRMNRSATCQDAVRLAGAKA
jgi:hypothetical protein